MIKKFIITVITECFKKDIFDDVIRLIVVICFLTFFKLIGWFDFKDLNNSMLISVLFTIIILFISKISMRIAKNKVEDNLKITSDYSKIIGKYEKDSRWITRKNPDNIEVVFPVIKEYTLYKKHLDIDDVSEMYLLPDKIDKIFFEILEAHSTSDIYNQLAIRLNDWKVSGDCFTISTQRTTYYDSLVTNRAMDYLIDSQWTIRELYQYGPFFPELSDSPLSNHLGFHVLLETQDNQFVFVKRDRRNSIAKNTYGCSVQASLKAKYSIKDGKLTQCGIKDAIIKEIEDEIKLREEHLEKFTFEENAIAAYRDVMEGGKPQLLFYAKSLLTWKEVYSNFKKNKNKSEWKLEDGRDLYSIHKNELKDLIIFPDRILHKGKTMITLPTTSASLVMLIEYLSFKEME